MSSSGAAEQTMTAVTTALESRLRWLLDEERYARVNDDAVGVVLESPTMTLELTVGWGHDARSPWLNASLAPRYFASEDRLHLDDLAKLIGGAHQDATYIGDPATLSLDTPEASAATFDRVDRVLRHPAVRPVVAGDPAAVQHARRVARLRPPRPGTDPTVLERSRKAKEAIGAHDYARVVRLLGPVEPGLSRGDRLRLSIARKRSS